MSTYRPVGFLWIDEDHPGDDTVKNQLKDSITGNTVFNVELANYETNLMILLCLLN